RQPSAPAQPGREVRPTLRGTHLGTIPQFESGSPTPYELILAFHTLRRFWLITPLPETGPPGSGSTGRWTRPGPFRPFLKFGGRPCGAPSVSFRTVCPRARSQDIPPIPCL